MKKFKLHSFLEFASVEHFSPENNVKIAGPGVTKHSRESSHSLTDKTTTRTTSIYSDKRISEKNLEKLEI